MPNRPKNIFSFIAYGVMLILLSGCMTIYNPATEKTENLFIDTQSEVALGRDIDIQMQRKFKIEKGPYANNRLSAIGQKIAAVSDRQDESLADRLSVKYAKKGGLNPYGAVTFFEKLKKEAEKQGPGFNLVFLSSHPPIEERIQNVKREIETLEKGR